MSVRKDKKRNRWLVEAYVNSKRIRKWFETRKEAVRFLDDLKQTKTCLPSIQAKTKNVPLRLSELAHLWYELHGQTLTKGYQTRNKLLLIAKSLGDPLGIELTVEQFAEYRMRRLNGQISFETPNQGAQVSTINLEHSIFKAMFNELKRFGKWEGENPINGLKLFREKEKPLTFLRKEEIQRLLNCCEVVSIDLKIVVLLCLSTGARWSEIAHLQSSQLIPYKISFVKTKSGKNRTVPIAPEIYNIIPIKQGKLFKVSFNDFNKAIKMAKIELPKNQLTHILRHTFASHFMMNGGNILILKDILGHYDIKMTMRYAHFAPSHLETAVTLNPMANLPIS